MRQFSKSSSKYLVHTLLKFFPYDNKAKYQINRRGSPLITDSPQTSFTTLLKKGRKIIKKYDFWHVTCETWHVIHNRYGPLGEPSLPSSCNFEVKVIPQVLKNWQNVPIDPWTSSITWHICIQQQYGQWTEDNKYMEYRYGENIHKTIQTLFD